MSQEEAAIIEEVFADYDELTLQMIDDQIAEIRRSKVPFERDLDDHRKGIGIEIGIFEKDRRHLVEEICALRKKKAETRSERHQSLIQLNIDAVQSDIEVCEESLRGVNARIQLVEKSIRKHTDPLDRRLSHLDKLRYLFTSKHENAVKSPKSPRSELFEKAASGSNKSWKNLLRLSGTRSQVSHLTASPSRATKSQVVSPTVSPLLSPTVSPTMSPLVTPPVSPIISPVHSPRK